MNSCKTNIAVLRRNGLGDLLCAYPLILYLKRKFQNASITLFVDQRNAPLMPYLPAVDQMVVIPSSGNKYWNLYRSAKPYRKKFDLAIAAKTSPMKLNNLFLYWLKAKERIAYVDKSWHSKLINRPILYDNQAASKMHQALKGLKTIAPELQDVPSDLYPVLHIPDAIKQKYSAENMLHPIVLISATTTKESNRLVEATYAELLNRLYQVTPFSVRIIGELRDQMRAANIASHLLMPTKMHFPRNFDEFMILLGTADLFFVGDGGVAHIGAAMGKHGVVLFGQTNPEEWSPLSKRMHTFYHPVDVNHLQKEKILEGLKRTMIEVEDGRNL